MDELLLTAAQMRALERAAIDSGVVTGLELMERAGVGAVDAILAEWPELAAAPGRAVVLCGPGNNGGDGFVVARVLKGKGWDVEVFLYGDAKILPPDARLNYARWSGVGAVQPASALSAQGLAADLFVDALFGTGLTRPVSDASLISLKNLIARANTPPGSHIAALDFPSGICSDSGRVLGREHGAIGATDLTIAFGAPKLGHYLAEGAGRCRRLTVVDLDLGARTSQRGLLGLVRQVDETEGRRMSVARLLGKPPAVLSKGSMGEGHHKYDHGHALIVTGGMGRTGAARLAARAALRIGAGLVTCAVPGAAMMECAVHLTAVMLRRCDDAAALSALLDDERINALCLGPGMGVSARGAALLDVALSSGRALVLDADALTVLAARDAPFAMLHDTCVLTPHGGEFARLFPDIAARLDAPAAKGPAYSKVDATRDAARRAGCTVLFKGPDTVIADAVGHAWVNAAVYDRAAPWLATAGAGDVLAGIITGLLARGVAPVEAAGSAAWLHVETARVFGPGLIAEDLPEMLPRVLAALEA